ncbi:hypothetical protein B0E45_32035 [Sinorhizobium sp. A49]|uniref:hypothetical protein n=1 Tax=Sinorhizobium sp. A49 TaxID=1945861 RepID=UPI0009850DD8|nr:hypothetical protein [Sinorhizobium sp. A49]OOG61896.1 hypothetical protein B0E45_32035 [Sinorhizobium sp. A49]
MWKVFAVLYSLLVAFGMVFVGYLIATGALSRLTPVGWATVYTSFFMVLGTTIGLVAYAFNLNVPPIALWRPFSWLAGAWALYASYTTFAKVVSVVAGSSGDAIITNILWLSFALAVNYFSWLGVWRYGRRVSAAA